jgi:hypothetical protein
MMEEVQTKALGKAFLKMEKEGFVPTDQRKKLMFFNAIFQYGASIEDVAMMERACKGFAEAAGGDQRFAGYLANLRGQVAKAKAKQ